MSGYLNVSGDGSCMELVYWKPDVFLGGKIGCVYGWNANGYPIQSGGLSNRTELKKYPNPKKKPGWGGFKCKDMCKRPPGRATTRRRKQTSVLCDSQTPAVTADGVSLAGGSPVLSPPRPPVVWIDNVYSPLPPPCSPVRTQRM